MTDAIAMEASYSDFKLIKSRSCAQVILELPIERAEAFLSMFGVPQPGAERPVALALLNPEKPEKAERPNNSRVTRVALLCKDPNFQQWVREHINFDNWENAEVNAKEYILANLKLESRRELAVNDDAWQRMLGIIDGFNRWAGRAAELRS